VITDWYKVRITATDQGGIAGHADFNVLVNRKPVVVCSKLDADTTTPSIYEQFARIDVPWTYAPPGGVFSDPDNDPLTFIAGTMPSWMKYDGTKGTNGEFSGTAGATVNQRPQFQYIGRDQYFGGSTCTLVLIIEKNNIPVISNGIKDLQLEIGSTWSK
jgi:hypothetical protein